jgi:ABC-2 type transport system ATP-binding protein
MIVEDYLKYVAQIHGENPEERIPQLCQECGLKEIMDKNISELSRGNRQRVALAHALMANPEILILDEPTSGLDPNQVEDVRNIIREIGKTRTVIVSTHILSEVETICSRAIIISGGKLVADSPIEELKQRFGNNFAVKLSVANASFENLSKELKAINNVDEITLCKADSDEANSSIIQVLISVKGSDDLRPQIAKVVIQNNWDLFELSIQKNSLEDVFHVLTSAENLAENKKSNESEAASNE